MYRLFRYKRAIFTALLMLAFMPSRLISAQTDEPDSTPAKEEPSSQEDTKAQSSVASSQEEFSMKTKFIREVEKREQTRHASAA